MNPRSAGFTLTELAVVLVIVALLLGGMLVPLSTQYDLRKVADTESQLRDIREALLGFAAINGRLPCPDTDTDPTVASYGVEESDCSGDATTEGFLPWKTLGVREFDGWGAPWQSPGSTRLGHWRYRVERKYADSVQIRNVIMLPGPTSCPSGPFLDDCLLVQNNAGLALTESRERPIAIVYSVGPDNVANGQNASYEKKASDAPTYQAGERTATFDDMLIWISRPSLVNRMVAAGKLP